METRVWPEENSAALLRESVKLEARRWHRRHLVPATAADWAELRQDLQRRLLKAAGLLPEPERPPLDVIEHGTIALEGYRIVKLSYCSRPGLRVTGNLYVPDGTGPFPGVLGTHGHWSQGKIAARVASRGHLLARQGFVTLIVDAFGSGERGTQPGQYEYHGAQIGAGLLSLGETLLGAQVWDNQRGLDLLQSLPMVDPDRLGVTGASGGGNQTMWLAALDPRIRAAVPVVSVGTFESYIANPNCICEALPGGLTLTEEWAVLAMTAPGALLILNALRDSNAAFQVTEMMRSFQGAQEVYRRLGHADRLDCRAIDLTHGYWPEMQRHMLGWFRYWLKGEGTGRPCEIPAGIELPEADLLCFPDHQRPTEVASITAYASARGPQLKRAALARTAAAPARRQDLAAILGADLAAPAAYQSGRRAAGLGAGRHLERFTLEGPRGALLPGLLLRGQPGAAPGTLLAVHAKGKAGALEEAVVREALAAGRQVCLVDLRNQGESRWDSGQVRPDHEAARTALWLGRTMIGEWVEDLLGVAGALAADGPVSLAAWGEPALAALAAAALGGGAFERVAVYRCLASYVLEGSAHAQSMSIFIPGILRWGDVSLIAALAEVPVELQAPVSPAGAPLGGAAAAALQQEIATLAAAMGLAAAATVRAGDA